MTRKYYSARPQKVSLTLTDLYNKLQHLYLLFRERDYFKSKLEIIAGRVPDAVQHETALMLNFQPFPITKWPPHQITEEHIFDTIEFLYDNAAKPGELVDMTSPTGFQYSDYDTYDSEVGREEFREKANMFLADYRAGYELAKDGRILAATDSGLKHITEAEIVPYDAENVDNKVRNAILKWRNRNLSLSEKKEAIRELADVFEWLKKTKRFDSVLNSKDSAAIFDIANNFAIRHHNPQQKTNYDKSIWYSWMFHFYLATYHATVRLLLKENKGHVAKNATII